MTAPASFLWHDYETFGTHPGLDRPAQFAALRTDSDLQVVGEPVTWFCKPPVDVLPHPMACLVTGITPQEAERRGLVEADFARRIHALMMEPGTCAVGYNSLRFDDEFTRHLFYRNLFEPYEREWKNGNSRWDLLDLARMFYALRPAGMVWPEHEPGCPSFRLEDLSRANGIEHSAAHDALADVQATLELARRLRAANPRLFAWGLELRSAPKALELLDPLRATPLVHSSSRFPATRGCTTLVLPLAFLPRRPKSVIVIDLMADPRPLLELDAAALSDRVFTPAADLPESESRVPLKAVHANKVPMLAPAAVLRGVDLDRIGLDEERCAVHARLIRSQLPAIRRKVTEVFDTPYPDPSADPDLMLYSGGFFTDRDRATLARIRAMPPEGLGDEPWSFDDARLAEMLFRYRARNWPERLRPQEADRWRRQCRERLTRADPSGRLTFDAFHEELRQAREATRGDTGAQPLLDQLEAWAGQLERGA